MPLIRKKNKQNASEFDAGPGIHESRTRSRNLVVAGLVLALCAGIGSYVILSRAQEPSGSPAVPKVAVVVAARPVAARTALTSDDVVVRDVPLDATNAEGTFTAAEQVVGKTAAVALLPGQLVTSNLFAFSEGSAALAILDPGESITPKSPDWRAVSITVPDDRAVGGAVSAGEHIDIFVTTTVNVTDALAVGGQFYSDKATKVTYQDVVVLSKAGTFYVIKVTEQVAEEIVHMQVSGSWSFSMALRPDVDNRSVDASKLGATTNLIIQRYGLPVPQTYPLPGDAINPGPSPVPATPNPTPVQAAVASPSPSTAP